MFYRNRTDFAMLHVECLYTQIAASDTHPLTFTNWELYTCLAGCGVSGANLCSRDISSRDHAFPSGRLATPTTVSKTPRGRNVNRVKHPLLRLSSTPKRYMKTYFDCLYAIIGIIYTV